MKFRAFFLISIILLVASCSPNDEFLKEDPKGKLFPETYFNNEQELEMFVNDIYRSLADIWSGDYERFGPALTGADDIAGPYDPEFLEFEIFQPSPGNPDIYTAWERAYGTIKSCNALINNYQRAAAATPEDVMLRAAGQAHFARAYMYYWLVRLFNEVPLVLGTEPDFEIKKSKNVDIYAVIVEDLKKAEQWLPIKWNGIMDHKIMAGYTQGAAKATLANVYLSMAGYPVSLADGYTLAMNKAKEVIDAESTYGYRLLDDCSELWKPLPLKHDELVLGFFYNKVNQENRRAPYACQPRGNGYQGWDLYCAEINFFNKFPEGPRKEATFVTKFHYPDGSVKDWSEMDLKHPYYKKMWETEGFSWDKMWESPDWASNKTNQAIRYAEVLLTYAEAQAMAEGTPNTLAYKCVNRVRTRAGLADLQAGLSGTAFRDAVVMERAWEFAGLELASRWFDLVRLERVEAAATDRDPREEKIPVAPSKKNYFCQIPELEVQINPNLKLTY